MSAQLKKTLFQEAIEQASETGHASVSMLQRRLMIGYIRASELIERMKLEGYLGEPIEPGSRRLKFVKPTQSDIQGE